MTTAEEKKVILDISSFKLDESPLFNDIVKMPRPKGSRMIELKQRPRPIDKMNKHQLNNTFHQKKINIQSMSKVRRGN